MDNINVVLDISSFYWDKDDYFNNRNHYFGLVEGLSSLIMKLDNEKPQILLRENLLNEIYAEFPYKVISSINNLMVKQVMQFLRDCKCVSYLDSMIQNIISIPNQEKEYFTESTKKEIGYLISKIHSDDETSSVYFTFKYLWKENDKLKTETEEKANTYETIIVDNGTDLDDFFAKLKPKFDHNPKHDKKPKNTKEKWLAFADKDAFNSRLSCYNGADNIQPQKILDKKYPHLIGDEYIGYDGINEVFVRFRCHKDNFYHGFDEYDIDNIDKIPLNVREYFRK